MLLRKSQVLSGDISSTKEERRGLSVYLKYKSVSNFTTHPVSTLRRQQVFAKIRRQTDPLIAGHVLRLLKSSQKLKVERVKGERGLFLDQLWCRDHAITAISE